MFPAIVIIVVVIWVICFAQTLKTGLYAYAQCQGCKATVIYDKCRNCKQGGEYFSTDRSMHFFEEEKTAITCWNCKHVAKNDLPCPVCGAAIKVYDFRIGKKGSCIENGVSMSEGASASQNQARGRARPDEEVL